MRTIPLALAAHFAQPTTAIATLIHVTRTDGAVYGFTDHDEPLTYDGVAYEAALGYSLSDVANSDDLSVGNLEAVGFLTTGTITEADLLNGLWDHAAYTVRQVNWSDLTQGDVVLSTGNFGKVSLQRQQFTVELLGLMQRLQSSFGIMTSAKCRATLGDVWCTVSLGAYTVAGTVDSVDDDAWTITDAARAEAAGYFERGLFTYTSGANDGLSREVKSFAAGVFTLQLPFPYAASMGDTYSAIAGCDGLHVTCRDKFANIVNRQAEDFIRGDDQAMQVGRHE